MPLWLDLLRTPMAAPETATLRRLRFAWQASCLATALVVGLFTPLHRAVGRLVPLAAAVSLLVTAILTWLYISRKHRADTAFLDSAVRSE